MNLSKDSKKKDDKTCLSLSATQSWCSTQEQGSPTLNQQPKNPIALLVTWIWKIKKWDLLRVLRQIVTAMLVTFLINAPYENTSRQCLTVHMQAKLQSEWHCSLQPYMLGKG